MTPEILIQGNAARRYCGPVVFNRRHLGFVLCGEETNRLEGLRKAVKRVVKKAKKYAPVIAAGAAAIPVVGHFAAKAIASRAEKEAVKEAERQERRAIRAEEAAWAQEEAAAASETYRERFERHKQFAEGIQARAASIVPEAKQYVERVAAVVRNGRAVQIEPREDRQPVIPGAPKPAGGTGGIAVPLGIGAALLLLL